MLDRFVASKIESTTNGILASVGDWTLVFVSSMRDRDFLISGQPKEIYCTLELDLKVGSLQALGFADADRRALYQALRAVPGIGRHSALAVLDAGEVRDTLRAVSGEDADYFLCVPGLGAKKVKTTINSLKKRYSGFLPKSINAPITLFVEARDSLLCQGYSAAEAERSLLEAIESQTIKSSEEWLARLSSAETT